MRYGLKHDHQTVKYLGEKEKAISVSAKWKPHHRNECPVCFMHQKQKKAGASKKRNLQENSNLTGQNLKFNSNEMDIFGNLFHDDTVQIPSHPLAVNLPQSQSKHFMCDICKDLFSLKSVMTNCGHYFCSVCLSGVFKNASSNTIHCPTCECIVHFDDIQPIQKKFKEQLVDLNVCFVIKVNHQFINSIKEPMQHSYRP